VKRLAIAVLMMLCGVGAGAEELEGGRFQVEQVDWSATLIGQYRFIDRDDRSDDEVDFFDQYEWTANKSSSFPAEFAIRDGSLDLIGAGDTPLLQALLESPTSNLGISGSQVDEAFLNQHVDVLGRIRGMSLDLEYDRIRTEQLRLFPNTAGAGLLFDDHSNRKDRFSRDRTGFSGELRVQPYVALDRPDAIGSSLVSELSLRGGYQSRDGNRQLLLHRDPSNQWLGLTDDADRSVSDIGGGLVLTPFDNFTLSLRYDHERFRWKSQTFLERDLGFSPPNGNRTIGFVPDSDRSTAVVRVQAQPFGQAQFRAAFRYSELEQVDDLTPVQETAGLNDNRVRHYAANADLRVPLMRGLELVSALHFDRRSNEIDRDTPAFNPDGGTQVDAFLRRFDRFVARMELHQSLLRLGGMTLGVSYEDIDRDLEFPRAALRVPPENSWIDNDTRLVTVYARGNLRPVRGFKVFGEIGYRTAPETGYVTELDDYLFGKLRLSYLVPLARPIVLTGFLRGHRGENNDFEAVNGVGSTPSGPRLGRRFEQSAIGGGITVSYSPFQDVALFASFYGGRNEQESGLDLSNLQRYFQDDVPIAFRSAGDSRFHDRQLNFVTGVNWRIAALADAALSYSFTQAVGSYRDSSSSRELDLIEDNHRIDSDIHGFDLEVGAPLREGLRVFAGYRLQYFKEEIQVPSSVASVVRPGDRDTFQHTVTLGFSLTPQLFSMD
jgi:hypothetical protein